MANRRMHQNQGPAVTQILDEQISRNWKSHSSEIESNLRWTPDRINVLPCLQRYLDALPIRQYLGQGYHVVVSDRSLQLNRSSTKEPAMGARVMWHDAAIPHRSGWVGGQHSSTRAELVAVVVALQGTHFADDLAILIDSADAIQRLRWKINKNTTQLPHMGLGSTSLDAQIHAGTIFCQIELQEMGTHGYCIVRLRTWGRNISPPATSLPPYSSSKQQTNCARQRGKRN